MGSCETCRYMRNAHSIPGAVPPAFAGYCHVDPPVLHPNHETGFWTQASFKPVNLAAWCGRYRFSLRAWWAMRRARRANPAGK